MWPLSIENVGFCFLIFLELTVVLVPVDGKKQVVNYEPNNGSPPTTTASDKPSIEIPIPPGKENGMEEILNNPHFRFRKTDIGEDPNAWADALNAYDKIAKSAKDDPNGVFQLEPNPLDSWDDISDSLAGRHHLPPDSGLQGRSFKRQLVNPTTTVATTDNVTGNATDTNANATESTTTLSTTKPTTTPRPTRPPIQCPGNAAATTNPVDPSNDILYLRDRLMPNTDSELFDKAFGGCTKGQRLCFGSETGCIEKKQCRVLVTMQNKTRTGGEGDRVSVTLLLNDNAKQEKPFVGIAFSPDRFLGGGDHLIYCINSKKALPGTGKDIALYMAHVDDNQKENMQQRRSAFLSSVCMVGGYVCGHLPNTCFGCAFELARYIEEDDYSVIDILNKEFWQYLAFGKYLTNSGSDDAYFGQIDSSRQYFSSEKLKLSKALKNPKILLPRSQFLIYLHVWFAASAFTFLMPSSSIIAKFGREVFSSQKKLAKYKMPRWLLTHIRLNFISLLLIISSLFVILIDLEFTWQSVHYWPKVHSIVGLVAMLIAFPGSGATGWVFNFENSHSSADVPRLKTKMMAWIHWGMGNMSYFLGILCVVTAGKMPQALAPCMVEYFGWMHLFLHVGILWLMAVDSWKLVKLIDGRYMFQRAILGPMIPWKQGEISRMKRQDFSEAAMWKMRRRVIVFHFITSFLCTFAICVLMILPTVLCRDEETF